MLNFIFPVVLLSFPSLPAAVRHKGKEETVLADQGQRCPGQIYKLTGGLLKMEVGGSQLELSDSGKCPGLVVMVGSKRGLKSPGKRGWLQEPGGWPGDHRGPDAEPLLSGAVQTDPVSLLFVKGMVCNPQGVNTSSKCRFRKLQFGSQSFK